MHTLKGQNSTKNLCWQSLDYQNPSTNRSLKPSQQYWCKSSTPRIGFSYLHQMAFGSSWAIRRRLILFRTIHVMYDLPFKFQISCVFIRVIMWVFLNNMGDHSGWSLFCLIDIVAMKLAIMFCLISPGYCKEACQSRTSWSSKEERNEILGLEKNRPGGEETFSRWYHSNSSVPGYTFGQS